MATTLTAPDALSQPFANIGDRAVIPDTTTSAGVASLAEGIPAECSLPIASGGEYVRRTDINGANYIATSHNFFMQNGGRYTFDSSVSTAIGGYPAGARLITTIDSVSVNVRSLVDNNTLDPATNLDGVNWVCDQYTDTEYIPLTGGTVALTQTATATYTYNIDDFVGTDLDTAQIRMLHISILVANNSNETYVYATLPDGTEATIAGCDGGGSGDTPTTPYLVNVPINKTQAASGSIDFRIVTNSGSATYTILGATQRSY